MANAGRPPKYKSAEEIQEKIDQYFEECKGKPLLDAGGKQIYNKLGYPVIIGDKPPTITGLALALGFTSRQALLNYQGKKEFVDTITRAKARVEQYTEERLFDKEGSSGAQFSLRNNFKGWNDLEEKKMDIELLKLENQINDSTSDATTEDNFLEALNATAREVWNDEPAE